MNNIHKKIREDVAALAEARKNLERLNEDMVRVRANWEAIVMKLAAPQADETGLPKLAKVAVATLREQEQFFHDYSAQMAQMAALCHRIAAGLEGLISKNGNASAGAGQP